MVKVMSVVETPNPDALKFMVDHKLVENGARSFDSPASAKDDPLASSLFALGPLYSVFYMDKFVTVTKPPTMDWTGLQGQVVEAIETHAKPVAEKPPAAAGAAGTDDEVLNRINQVLDENVRPALAGDGGGLEIIGYSDFVLTVHYQGACGSCPSSTSGTLFAIQNLLQRLIDPRIQVSSL
jgi:NFU1 iron-sulfur cluster scaffold homolog, mitochondrial